MNRHHFESQVLVGGTPAEVFEFLDDHGRLAAHMTQSSWMLAGTRMAIELDEQAGRALGSRMTLRGRVLGLALEVAEVVTRYQPPYAKAWQTVDSPKLLVVGPYAMGFELSAHAQGSMLRVFIDYALPERGIPRVLGRMLGRFYAAWCTRRMARDAALRFPPGS